MTRAKLPLAALATLTLITSALAADPPVNQPPPGYQQLFDGKTLNNWRGRRGDYSPYEEAKIAQAARDKAQGEWNTDMNQHWHVDADKGEIVSDGHGVYLTTTRDFGDFDMWVDWLMVSHNGDSGIYLRYVPQVQIWDPENPNEVKNGAPRGSGALWNNHDDKEGSRWPLVKADKPVGEWNRMHIRMIGPKVWVWLNDQKTVDGAVLENYYDHSKPIPQRGPFQLQTHGSEIRFRNIFAKDIPADEANAELSKLSGSDGYKNYFNGKTLEGWGGDVTEYEVRENGIFCKVNKGGNLHTIEEFTDFEAKLEFKLPPGGNNGLCIHYPGKTVPITAATQEGKVVTVTAANNYTETQSVIIKGLTPAGYNGDFRIISATATQFTYQAPAAGLPPAKVSDESTAEGHGDTAYIGTCELQVLDDTAGQYKSLDPRQYCGSIYGVVAAKTGFLRNVGEWNFEHVVVKGHHITVELNGTTITDADVSEIKPPYMHGSPHPGLMRTTGSFGFAGHDDPVGFRNIMIKRLDTPSDK